MLFAMQESLEDRIWNRACDLEIDRSTLRDGDRALAALLLAHGAAMNGGVWDMLDCLDEQELEEALAGYEYFGLGALRGVFVEARAALDAYDDDAEPADGAEHPEAVADRKYAQLVPDDEHLSRVFVEMYRASPDRFAPPLPHAQ